MPVRTVSRRLITIAEAKEILAKLEDPNPFQIRTLEYVNKFSKNNSTQAVDLVEKLVKEFDIERKDAIDVVNCMPSSVEELRTFFSTGKKRLIITAQLEKMLKILDKHR